MLTSTVLTDTNIVAAIYDGALTAPEVVATREKLDNVIAKHGKARMLVEYGDIDFGRMGPRGLGGLEECRRDARRGEGRRTHRHPLGTDTDRGRRGNNAHRHACL